MPAETPRPFPLVTSPVSPSIEGTGPALHRAGSLSYSGRGLAALFSYLLTADVVLTMIERVEAKILPVLLKSYHASDQQIAIIASSIAAILQLLLAPVVSYQSDRTRTRFGRRIPYILWVTPVMAISLAVTPYAPELANWLLGSERVAAWMAKFPWAPTMIAFAMITIAFRSAHIVLATMFFALFRDVVPSSHMGRFLALFRMVGAASTFITAYWLLGKAVTHAHEIFLGLAALNFLGFLVICVFVREGDYPQVTEKRSSRARSRFYKEWDQGMPKFLQ